MEGWIKLHRKIIDSGYFKDSFAVHLWVYLLIEATHKKRKTIFNGKIVELKEGQLITGRKKLSQETGISEQIIRKWLDLFEINQQITIQKTSAGSCISIVNYKSYQEVNQLPNQPLTSDQPATNQPLTTIQELKNDNNEENEKNSISTYNQKNVEHFNNCIDDDIWKESVSRTTGENINNIDKWIIKFSDYLASAPENHQILSQYRRHCTNWIKKELKDQKNGQSKSKQPTPTLEQLHQHATKEYKRIDLSNFDGIAIPKDKGGG